jgi:serine O-acetyltransferase
MIREDIKAKTLWLYGEVSRRTIIRACLSDATLSLLFYRAMSFCYGITVLKLIAAILCKLNALLCGAVIGMGARFGKGFVILHSVGVVVNTKVVAGDNIYLESGVVIGETKRGCPVLGSNVFIGTGAVVVGNITIGNNVTIGANAVVTMSFPDDVVIGGVPAKILRYKQPSETELVG